MACRHYGENAPLETFKGKILTSVWGQIFTFLFGARPFQYFGDDFLVAEMLDFVEELPTEWQQTWDHMQQKSGKYDGTSKWYKRFNLSLTAEFVSVWPNPPIDTRAIF